MSIYIRTCVVEDIDEFIIDLHVLMENSEVSVLLHSGIAVLRPTRGGITITGKLDGERFVVNQIEISDVGSTDGWEFLVNRLCSNSSGIVKMAAIYEDGSIETLASRDGNTKLEYWSPKEIVNNLFIFGADV